MLTLQLTLRPRLIRRNGDKSCHVVTAETSSRMSLERVRDSMSDMQPDALWVQSDLLQALVDGTR